jgi:hypothetical protein
MFTDPFGLPTLSRFLLRVKVRRQSERDDSGNSDQEV